MWRYRHSVLVLTTLVFATTMVARLVISPLVPDVTATFGVSTSDIGLALTGMWAAYALSQYPGGMLANAYGERRIILISVGLIAFASVLLASAPVFSVFAVVTILLGAAAGLPYSSTTSLLSKNFEDIGRAIGVYIAGAPFAGLVVPIVATAIASAFGWRTAIAFAAVVAVPVCVAVAFGIGRTPPTGHAESIDSAFKVETIVELLSRSGIRYTIALAIGSSFVWQATASFLPTFFVEHRSTTQAYAGVLFSGYFVIQGVTQPMTGWLSDRVGRDRAILLSLGSAMIGYSLLLVGTRSIVVFAAIPLLGLGMSWGAPIQSRFMDQLGEAEQTIGFGLVRTVYMTVGALGSVVVGVLADGFGWVVAFGFLAAIMGVEVVLLGLNAVMDLDY